MTAHLGAIVAVVVAGLIVAGARRVSTAAPFALTLLALVLANGSILRLKHVFLDARWGALVGCAAVLGIELLRDRAALRRLLVFAGLPVLGLVSALWSVDPRLTVERSASFGLLLVAAGGAAARWRRDKVELERAVDALAVVSVLVLLGSLVYAALSSRAFLAGDIRGLLENPNGLGIFLALTYPFVARALRVRGHWRLSFVVLAVDAALTVAARSRSGLVALVIVVVAARLARRPRVALALGAAVAVLAVVLLLVVPHVGGHQSTAPNNTQSSHSVLQAPAPISVGQAPHGTASFVSRLTGARSEAWPAAWNLIRSRPVLGYGFGTGDRVFSLYPNRVHFVFFEGANPSNGYLELGMDLGIVGGILFVLPLLLAARGAARELGGGASDTASGAVAAVLVASLAVAFVESTLTSAGAPWELLLWSAAAMCVLPSSAVMVAEGSADVRVLPRLRLPSRRVGIALAVLAAIAATLAIVVPRELRSTPPTRPEAAARTLERLVCKSSPCHLRNLGRVQQTFWWVEIARRGGSSCYVVDLDVFNAASTSLRGTAAAHCDEPPLVRRHALTVAVLDPAPPYYIGSASSPSGYEPAVVRELAHRLGVGLLTWIEAPSENVPSKADFVIHVFYRGASPRRTGVPYLEIPDELVVRRGSPEARVRTLAGLRRLRLGVIDSHVEQDVREEAGLHVAPTLYPTLAAATAALRARRLDALALDLGSAVGVTGAGTGLVMTASFPPRTFYTLRFRPQSGLLPFVERALTAMRRDGTLRRLQAELGPVPRRVPQLR